MTERPETIERLTQMLHVEKEPASPLESFARAAAYSAVEPINGVLRLATGKPVELVAPPERAEIGSGVWSAQQLGYGCGAAAWLLPLQKANSVMLRSAIGTSESLNFLSRRTANWVGAAAITGFEYGFLTPTKTNATLSDRVASGAVAAGTWTAMVTSVRGSEAIGFNMASRARAQELFANQTRAYYKQLRYPDFK